MAALSSTNPTLLDVARVLNPDGTVANVVEVLNEYNEILDDITFMEGNLPTGHKTTVRASIPTPTWRLLNQGVTPTKATTGQITETCGIMEAYSTIDKDVAMLNGNTAAFRFSQDLAHIEGMGQEFADKFIYGDTSINPEQFVGLAPRYYATSGTVTSGNVIDGLGTGSDNTSIWLVGWSERTVMGIFPKGSIAGLSVTDLGEQTVFDSDNKPYQAYRTHFQWKPGIAVKDWRFVVRICNIDVSKLLTAGDVSDVSENILKMMDIALDTFPPIGGIRPVFYCNNTVRSMLRVKMKSLQNVRMTIADIQSPVVSLKRPTLFYSGVPVRRIDAIASDEDRIVAA